MARRKYERLPDLVIEDPEEIARIDRMLAEAEADMPRKQGPRKRHPESGRTIEFWADTALQAKLEELNPGSPGVAAKDVLRQALGLRGD